MSDFADKIKKGIVPTEAEWESHLVEAHRLEPRMTPEAFARFTGDDGRNSYQVLAAHLPSSVENLRIVDLACGDGHFIPYILPRLSPSARVTGVDISPEGLALARAQIPDSRVDFMLARAQRLPFADASQDFVFCHMALMLMTPIEDAVHEIERILKPGGTFAAVVSGGTANGLYQEIVRIVRLYVQAHLPKFSEARKGTFELTDVFSQKVQVEEIQLRYHVPPEGILDYLKNMYFMPLFPDSVRRELHGDLLALAREHMDENGKVLFHAPLRCLTVGR